MFQDLLELMYGPWLQGFSTDTLVYLRGQQLGAVHSQEPVKRILSLKLYVH